MTPLRARIAERLVQAKNQTAMLTTFNEVDMTAIRDLRAKYQEAFTKRHGVKLGFMSFFVKAAVHALKEVPALNTRIDEVLEQIGLVDKAKDRVKTYSGGMKRRVNIGVGLLHKPRLLFMDDADTPGEGSRATPTTGEFALIDRECRVRDDSVQLPRRQRRRSLRPMHNPPRHGHRQLLEARLQNRRIKAAWGRQHDARHTIADDHRL